jgi:hypothetical protein
VRTAHVADAAVAVAVERAGGGEQAVAPGLPVEPAAVGPREERVVGIARDDIGPLAARLSPGAAHDDLTVQPAEAPPALADEPGRQVVEQFRM